MPYEVIDDAPKGRYEALPAESTQPSASRTDRVWQGMRDSVDSLAQLARRSVDYSTPFGLGGLVTSYITGQDKKVGTSIDKAGNALSDMGLPVAKSKGVAGVDALVKKKEEAYQASRGGETGFDGYRMLGNVISPVSLLAGFGAAEVVPAAASFMGRVLASAAGGGISGGLLSPVTGDDFWTEKGKQVAAGAVGGAVTPLVTGAISRVVSPNASVNPDLQLLRNEGVRPTIGQTLGGWANRVEEKAQSLPIVGDAIASARGNAREQFNNAAINRATAPIGVKVQGVGQGAVADAGDAISAAYTKAQNMLGGFSVDQAAAQQLTGIKMAATQLPQKEQGVFNSILKSIGTDVDPAGNITAEGFKRIDSKLGQEIAKYSGSSDAYQKELGTQLQAFQKALTDNAKRANPAAAAEFAKADRAWANLVRVEGASKNAMQSGGVFTPGQLNSAVRQADQSVRDRATARGTALMQDLSKAGQSVLGNQVPNSGTADRLMLGGAGLGAYFVDPLIPASLLGGAAMYTRPMQGLLGGAVSARPQSAQSIADAIRKGSTGLLPAAGQVSAGLLN